MNQIMFHYACVSKLMGSLWIEVYHFSRFQLSAVYLLGLAGQPVDIVLNNSMGSMTFVSLDTTEGLQLWLDRISPSAKSHVDKFAARQIDPDAQVMSSNLPGLDTSLSGGQLDGAESAAASICEPRSELGHPYGSLDDMIFHALDPNADSLLHSRARLSGWVPPSSWSRPPQSQENEESFTTTISPGRSSSQTNKKSVDKASHEKVGAIHLARRPSELFKLAKRRLRASLRASSARTGHPALDIANMVGHNQSVDTRVEKLRSYILTTLAVQMHSEQYDTEFRTAEIPEYRNLSQVLQKSLREGICDTIVEKGWVVSVTDNGNSGIRIKFLDQDMPRITLEFPRHDEESQRRLLDFVLATET